MGKVVRSVLQFAAVAVNFVPGIGQLASLAISAALTVGSSLLTPKPKSPANSPENINRLRANVDPLTPRKTVIGYTAMATDIRDEEFTDDQTLFHRFIVCASHKVQSIEEVWLDDELAWTTSGGFTSKFLGYLAVEAYTEGSAANAKNISARMGTTRRYTGLAWIYLRFKLTGNSKKTDSPFAQSVPTRITIRGRGAMLPDPRNVAHDMADQSTWTWNEDASRNPALALLFYLLGWKINGKLAVGKGIPPDRIDLDSFATAANICDELVPKVGGGTEPRYRCDGIWSEGDNPTTVIDMLKATMNADLDDVGGKLRLTVFHNDLATPVADFGDNDIIDDFTWQPLPPLDATFNVVRGLYTDPSDNSLYQPVDYPEQREASPDGVDRIDTFNLPMVQSPGQAQRLAAMRLARQQYAGVFEAQFQANAWKVQKNSIIRLTFGQTGFVQKFFRVAEMEIRQDGIVPLKLREENTAIYGEPAITAPISPVFSTPFDPVNSPFVQAINRWRGEHNLSDTYILDDLVTGPGSAGWRYINETPASGEALPVWPTTSNDYWENFTPPVDPPDIGVQSGATRNVARGTYDAGTTYTEGDIVLFSGSSYQLIVASSTGNAPPDAARWALIASAGSGPPGDDGLEGVTVIVTNETHTVATASDGTGGDYSSAGGTVKLLRGATELSPTFSIAAKTPNTSWISINSSGVYTVSDPGVDLATATIRATVGGVNYDRTYTIAKSKAGVEGPNLKLTSDAQGFTFADQTAVPASQTITLTAALTNLSGTVTWSTSPSVTLGGSGNTRTLSVANFGLNRQVTITAQLGGITEKLTVVRLDRDAFGGDTNRVFYSRNEGDRGTIRIFDTIPSTAIVERATIYNTSVMTLRGTATANGQQIFLGTAPNFPVQVGERLSISSQYLANAITGAAPSNRFFYIDFRNDAGAFVSRTNIDLGSGNQVSPARFSGFVTVPASATNARLGVEIVAGGSADYRLALVNPMVSGASAGQTSHPSFTPGLNADDGADVTSDAQVAIPQPSAFEIQADSSGVTTSDLSTISRSIKVFQGGVEQTSGVGVGTVTTSPSGSITAGTPTISGGIVTVKLTKADASGSLTVPITLGGKTYQVIIDVRRNQAAPSTPGAGDKDSYTDTSWANISGTTYVQIAGDGVVKSNASGEIAIRFAATYTADNGAAQCKVQYRLESGSTLIDVPGSETTGSTPIDIPGEEEPGEILYPITTLSGLTPDTDYRFRLLGRKTTGTSVLSWSSPNFTVAEP